MISSFDLLLLARALLAASLGFLVGWERKYSGAPARGATVGLASFSAAVVTGLALGLFPTAADRVVAAVITGSGFLGAGVIIHAGSGQVRGMTTAAGMWAMVAVGVAVGAGHELLGLALTLVVYVTLAWNTWPVLTLRHQRRASQHAAPQGAEQTQQTAQTEQPPYVEEPSPDGALVTPASEPVGGPTNR